MSEQRLDVIERQMKSLRRQVQQQGEWIDTHNSPLWKRLWFVAQGFRFRRLGVWYRARWNRSGWEF